MHTLSPRSSQPTSEWAEVLHDDVAMSPWPQQVRSELQQALAIAAAQRGRFAQIDAELAAVSDETNEENWDGYGAQRVQLPSIQVARSFLALLPTFPVPEIGVTPRGRITLEWYREPGLALSLSIGDVVGERSVRVAYAATFGNDVVTHGQELFDGSRVPPSILATLQRLYQNRARPI